MDGMLQPLQDTKLANLPKSGHSTSIREKLADLFGATEFVRVINPDTENYYWQYLPLEKEHINFDSSSSTVPMKITYRDSPEVYLLEPSQSAIIIGANAYLMIEGLVKKLMSKKAIQRTPTMRPGEARNFNFSDDAAQHDWIRDIYLGKAMPSIMPINASTNKPEQLYQPDDIDNDLGLTSDAPSTKKRPGPKPRQQAIS